MRSKTSVITTYFYLQIFRPIEFSFSVSGIFPHKWHRFCFHNLQVLFIRIISFKSALTAKQRLFKNTSEIHPLFLAYYMYGINVLDDSLTAQCAMIFFTFGPKLFIYFASSDRKFSRFVSLIRDPKYSGVSFFA